MSAKQYPYVGPENIKTRVRDLPPGTSIRTLKDLVAWIETQEMDSFGFVVATFVISVDGMLKFAGRHSEHVACAGGEPVLSAGEMAFDGPGVEWVTNQSTGYCPEMGSWDAVAAALDAAGIPHPREFTTAFEFRICPQCRQINIVKEDWFYCGNCDAELPEKWNVS